MTGTLFDWRAHLKVHPAADLLPMMSEAEIQELAENVRQNGPQQRIVLWRQRGADGKVIDWLIDGRSRLDALAKLGLVGPKHPKGRHETPHHYARRPPLTITWPECEEDDQAPFFPSSEEGWFQFHEGLKTDADVYECVLALNVQRRHLNAEQKRDLIVKLLKLQPERSNRWLAAQLKVDHKTLGVVRRDLEATGEIPHFERTVGADGKTRSAKVDKPAVEPVSVVQDKHWYDDETWDWSYRAVAPWVTRTLMETCWSMIGSPSRGTVWESNLIGGVRRGRDGRRGGTKPVSEQTNHATVPAFGSDARAAAVRVDEAKSNRPWRKQNAVLIGGSGPTSKYWSTGQVRFVLLAAAPSSRVT
jgi:hypothetical protein